MEGINSGLCRICLQEGAVYPIFDYLAVNSIHTKLSECFKCEKIKDINGFPRHICAACNTTLDTLFTFINKYKESTIKLELGLKLVKKESKYNSDTDVNDLPDVEIDIDLKAIKIEDSDHFDDDIDEKPLVLLKSLKKEPIKKEKKSKRSKDPRGSRSNQIASSILEGNFLWTGEKWCMKIGQTTLKKIGQVTLKKLENKEPRPRAQNKVTVPNIPRAPEPKLCDICGNVFKTQDRLNIHKKSAHLKNPVQCPKCPRICVSDYYLKRHVKRRHEHSRDFTCSVCGHGFAFRGEMMSHIKNVHNKHMIPKKVFSCKLCDKTYKCPKSVLVHERSVHTGQRPAQCSVCGSSFYHEDYLKEHMRLHTGETPFKCPICGRGYAQRGNMKSHLRIHRVSEVDAITLSKMRPNYLKLLKI